jgi:hypothetical protein
VTITIDAVHKPAQTVATATATLTVDSAPYAEVLAAGLAALGETPGSLFGAGVRNDEGDSLDPRDPAPLSGEVIVWAWRD